jgi:hypothetical protein
VKYKGPIMSKEISKFECRYCDSAFKVIYDPAETSGYPKLCPFCGSDLDSDDDYDEEDE